MPSDGPELSDATDSVSLRQVYGRFPTGVMAVCARHDGQPIGFAASSFNTVSTEPPLVVVSVQRSSTTWPLLARAEAIGLSVFATTQVELCRRLATRGGFDRFDGVDWWASERDAVFVTGTAAWLECTVAHVEPVGDHDLAVLRVLRHGIDPQVTPLVFHDSGFHSLAEQLDATQR